MEYRIKALNSGEAEKMPQADWVRLMTLAGQDSYRFQPPELIPPTEALKIAEALKKALADLPEEPRDMAAPDPLDTATPESGWDKKNALEHFGVERRAFVEDFIELCEQGALEVSRLA
jgi:hypothetical protein